MIHRTFLTISLLLLSLSVFAQSTQSVLFGERNTYLRKEPNVLRVFLDRNGDFYPEVAIPDAELQENKAALRDYYAANEAAFLRVAQQYGLSVTAYSEEAFGRLQSRIAQSLADSLNAISEELELFVLIHCFRKPLRNRSGGTTSVQDYAAVRQSIHSRNVSSAPLLFLEVYWDGTYDCCFGRQLKVNKRIFRLYEEVAQVQASQAGYGLRRLITQLDRNHLNIVTHSLGAQVGLSLLSNTFDERVSARQQSWATPQQDTIRVALLAPAISAAPFAEYHERTTGGEHLQQDNYVLSIIYNEKDFVLRKRWKIFGPGPRKYGNTSLGCNCRKEAEKLKERFQQDYPRSSLTLYQAQVGGTHRFVRYVRSQAFTEFLQAMRQ